MQGRRMHLLILIPILGASLVAGLDGPVAAQEARPVEVREAARVQAFWARVSCVDISVYAEVYAEGGNNTEAKHLERSVADRLATVWRREMPDQVGRASSSTEVGDLVTKRYSSQAKREGSVDDPLVFGCSDVAPRGGARWQPRIRILIRAGAVPRSGLFYGVVTSEFSLTFYNQGNSLFCTSSADPCVGGPGYKLPRGQQATKPEDAPLFWSFDVDLKLLYSRGPAAGDPIFANVSRERLEGIGIETGEALIQGIASRYYEAKARLRE